MHTTVQQQPTKRHRTTTVPAPRRGTSSLHEQNDADGDGQPAVINLASTSHHRSSNGDMPTISAPPPFVRVNDVFEVHVTGGKPKTKVMLSLAFPFEGDAQRPVQDGQTPEDKILRAFRNSRSKRNYKSGRGGAGGGATPPKSALIMLDAVEFDSSGNAQVRLRCSADGVGTYVIQEDSLGVRSIPFDVCRNALVRDDSVVVWEDDFYKDLGPRTRTMDLIVRVALPTLPAHNPALESCKLSMHLYFDDGNEADPKFLLVIPENVSLVDGTAKVSFRVNEVSRNHASRKFVLLIDGGLDVIPALSKPVLVLSKPRVSAAAATAASTVMADYNGRNPTRAVSGGAPSGLNSSWPPEPFAAPPLRNPGLMPPLMRQMAPPPPSAAAAGTAYYGGGIAMPSFNGGLSFSSPDTSISSMGLSEWTSAVSKCVEDLKHNSLERANLERNLFTLLQTSTVKNMVDFENDRLKKGALQLSSMSFLTTNDTIAQATNASGASTSSFFGLPHHHPHHNNNGQGGGNGQGEGGENNSFSLQPPRTSSPSLPWLGSQGTTTLSQTSLMLSQGTDFGFPSNFQLSQRQISMLSDPDIVQHVSSQFRDSDGKVCNEADAVGLAALNNMGVVLGCYRAPSFFHTPMMSIGELLEKKIVTDRFAPSLTEAFHSNDASQYVNVANHASLSGCVEYALVSARKMRIY